MRDCRFVAAGLCGGVLLLGACGAQPGGTASQASVPALQPNMARVWVLRQSNAPGGNVAADPMVFANGASLAQSAQGTAYFHDFQPGTYRLTVQSYGTPADLVDLVELAPETEAYVQVQAVPNWEMGSTSGGVSFAVLTMSPQEVQAYIQTMTNLGQR
ncbi:MAG: hypothetical protein WB611_09895 [Stellaceae bacterium]